jgi:hypothetical protein
MLVSDGETPETIAPQADTTERVAVRERQRTARLTCETVDRIIETFAPEDRLILRMRFREALKAPEIARRLHIDQKKIYKRVEKLLAMMKTALIAAGIDRRDIDMLVSGGDQEIHFDSFDSEEGIDDGSPSHPADGETGDDDDEGKPK